MADSTETVIYPRAGRRDEDIAGAILREAASGISQGLLVVDADMRTMFINLPYHKFFNVPTDHPKFQVGTPIDEMLGELARTGEYGPGDPEKHVEDRIRPIRERTTYNIDRQLSNGMHVQITGNPLENGGYVFTFTDVTHRVLERERLDRQVRERTSELHDANAKLVDGIEYAKLIQRGILARPDFFDELFREHFILFRPVDIVGGDFHFGVRSPQGIFIGLGDCTGHSVPGAMMTMMSTAICRRAISECGQDGPAAVLMATDRIVRSNLQQEGERLGPDNGLELSLIRIDPDSGDIRIASAGIDVLLQKSGAISRLRGTRHGVGYGRRALTAGDLTESRFKPGEIDRIFMSSDGILDQSGGEKGFGFGRRRLIEVLEAHARLPLEEQGNALTAALDDYQGSNPQRDDIAVIGFCPALR